ncbi:hypothetical protein BGZ63DRAFT_491508 [Mariannaea sp. PMI_226]|nr:hypothetical protein BGZ63DRAFT_491508 [Mariannaea sp. PMI_226]
MTPSAALEKSSPIIPNSQGVTRELKRRSRKPVSCEPCRHSKLRCDRRLPCATCLRRGWQDSCAYGATRTESIRPPHRRRGRPTTAVQAVPQPQQAQLIESSESASPRSQSPEPIHHRWDNILSRPPLGKNAPILTTTIPFTLSFGPIGPTPELLALLPPDNVCEYLVSRYFAHLCPLFHILHGPTFQKQYSAFLQDRQRVDLSWLALLFAICSLTLKTTEPNDSALTELWQTPSSPKDLPSMSQQCRNAAMMALSQDHFLVRHNLNTLEAILVLVHTISDSEGAEYGWVLLGNALNIGIALRCHSSPAELNCIERERRRRCWAGILILHTYQALLFRDTDLSFLCNMKFTMPAEVNDNDILEDEIIQSPSHVASVQLTQMSLMRFQIGLFQLSTQICNHISGPDRLSEELLTHFDSAVLAEQQRWDSVYLVHGARSIIDTASYAHWCLLQTFAHQLYLLLHRPFHNSRSTQFRPESRDRCVKSSLALMNIHREFYELPRLKSYRWLVNGSISCNALHGAVALTSCLLDMPNDSDFTEHIPVIDATVLRLEKLRTNSPACASVYPILRHLRSRLSRQDPAPSPSRETAESKFDDWVTSIDWFRPEDIDWDFWNGDYSTLLSDDHQTAVF